MNVARICHQVRELRRRARDWNFVWYFNWKIVCEVGERCMRNFPHTDRGSTGTLIPRFLYLPDRVATIPEQKDFRIFDRSSRSFINFHYAVPTLTAHLTTLLVQAVLWPVQSSPSPTSVLSPRPCHLFSRHPDCVLQSMPRRDEPPGHQPHLMLSQIEEKQAQNVFPQSITIGEQSAGADGVF